MKTERLMLMRLVSIIGVLAFYSVLWVGAGAIFGAILSVDRVTEFMVGTSGLMLVVSIMGLVSSFLIHEGASSKNTLRSDGETFVDILLEYRTEIRVASAIFLALHIVILVVALE